MLVKFRVNLGSVDAARLDLDHLRCTDGAVVDVSRAAAAELVSRGIAGALPEVKGVPEKATVSEPKPPEIQAANVSPEPKPHGKPKHQPPHKEA